MKLGRYELLAPIAKGGMAQIYRARLDGPAGFAQFFAIKRILPQFSGNDDFRRLFINEAKVASLLRHPNIVSVLELGQEKEGLYLVMEYVDGIDLHRLLTILAKQDRWLPPELSAYIVAGLLRALAYAHSRTDDQGRLLGIVHRDVTPHNTLLTREGLVKLADFGIAKAAFTTFKTAQGLTRGKLGYMSPEQIRGGKLTGASDLFTVGIMLLELLTGHLRTKGRSPKELVKETIQGGLATHPGLKDAPAALADLCKHLLATKPEHRPTATEALEALASSGWDKDRAQALAALLSEVPVAAPGASKRTSPARPRNAASPSHPPAQKPSDPGTQQQRTEFESPPIPDHHPDAGEAETDRLKKGPARVSGKGGRPAESMDELDTVILDTSQKGHQGAPRTSVPDRAPSPQRAAAPSAAMDALPTVILDEKLPLRPDGISTQTPDARKRTSVGSHKLSPWRLGLRTILAFTALVFLFLALGYQSHRQDSTTKTSPEPPRLPKGRVLLVSPGKTEPSGLNAPLYLDGQPVPLNSMQVALEPGTHLASWLRQGRTCARKNILVEADKPIRLEKTQPCPPAPGAVESGRPTMQKGTRAR